MCWVKALFGERRLFCQMDAETGNRPKSPTTLLTSDDLRTPSPEVDVRSPTYSPASPSSPGLDGSPTLSQVASLHQLKKGPSKLLKAQVDITRENWILDGKTVVVIREDWLSEGRVRCCR